MCNGLSGFGVYICVGVVLFAGKEGVQRFRSNTPAAEVKVAVSFHGHLQSAFPTQALAGRFLVLEVGGRIEGYLALVGGIGNVLADRVGGTLTDGIDDGTGFFQAVKFNQCLSPHQHDIGVTEYIVVHRKGLPAAIIGFTFRTLGNFLHRRVVAVYAGSTGILAGIQRIFSFIFVGERRHADSMEQARIPLLVGRFAIDGIVYLVVEVVKHWQTVPGLESVHQILGRLVAVPSACPDSPASVQHIRPVGTSVGCVVIGVVRGLYGKNGFLAILVVGQKDVAEIFQVAIFRVYHSVGIVDDFLHIVAVDMAYAGRGFVAVTPRQV